MRGRDPSRRARATGRSRPTSTPSPTRLRSRRGRARRAASRLRRRGTRRGGARRPADVGSPLTTRSGTAAVRPCSSRSRSAAMRAISSSRRSCVAASAAASATMPATFCVPAAQAPLVTAAFDERHQLDAVAAHEHADTLRAAELVARDRDEVGVGRGRAEVEPLRRLHRVGVEHRTRARGRAPASAISSSGCTMPVSLFTSITETTAVRSSSAAASRSRSTVPAAVAGTTATRAPWRPQAVDGAEHGLVLDAGGDHAVGVAAVERGPGRALDGEVVALAAATGEDDLARARARAARRPARGPPRARSWRPARRAWPPDGFAACCGEERAPSPRPLRVASASMRRDRGRPSRQWYGED